MHSLIDNGSIQGLTSISVPSPEKCRIEDETNGFGRLLTENGIDLPARAANRSKAASAIGAINAQSRSEDRLVPFVVSWTRGRLRPAVGESRRPFFAEDRARLEGLLRRQTRSAETERMMNLQDVLLKVMG